MARLNVYALGGGLGHAMRLLALARVASARGHTVHALLNASRLPVEALRLPGLDLVRVPRASSRDDVRDLVRAAPRADAWIVDTFPRGILGELEPGTLSGRRIWIHRDLDPRYAERPEVIAAARAYELALVPGRDEQAPLAHQVQAERTDPWLALDSGGLLSREEARAALGADPSRPLIVVSSSGPDADRGLWSWVASVLEHAQLGVVRLATAPERFPLLKYLPGVDLLVGGGGYHTVNEARATATPLLALPQPRTYDRQALRLRHHERVATGDELVARAKQVLATPRPPVPAFQSGAHQGLELIERLLG